jgi:tRNA pseudouridine13 synthase
MDRLKPPAAEVAAGLEEYSSASPGIGGRLKESPADFIVREITPEGAVLDLESDTDGDMSPGEYTHFTLVKEDWDTMRAVGEISKRLGVSRNRLAFAGTKDRRAITAQRVSVQRVPVERLKAVMIKDVRLKDFGYSDENLGLGSLKGNRFTVRVRGVCDGAAERIAAVEAELEAGFPNYFGLQRFGDVRPITHEVGRLMLKGDFEAAAMTYLAGSFEGEDGPSRTVREKLAADRDFQSALNGFPAGLGYEKAMLNRLVQSPGDFRGALRELPKNLQRMFIHAYQGHVFNRALSECVRRSLPADRLPLVGLKVPPDDISRRVLDGDGVAVEDFGVKGMGELASRGEYREAFAAAEGFSWKVEGDGAVFDFSLGKGSYATVLLREYMKNG